MKAIADTGVIVALLAVDDPAHDWAAAAFRRHAPFSTCEAVLVEACSFFENPEPVLKLLIRGDLVLEFLLVEDMARVLELCTRYADQPMDLADACVVRMSERHTRSKVWTVDRTDFTVYRRNRNQPVPCDFPSVK